MKLFEPTVEIRVIWEVENNVRFWFCYIFTAAVESCGVLPQENQDKFGKEILAVFLNPPGEN